MANARVFTVVNKCRRTIWPAVISNAAVPQPFKTGFMLAPGQTYLFESQYQWYGQFWARTGCRFNKVTGKGKCRTGDCHGLFQCDGYDGHPPVTVASFALDTPDGDHYSVDMLHGFNIPITVTPTAVTSSQCKTSSCVLSLTRNCPQELQVKRRDGRVVGCNSACDAFGDPLNCCQDPYWQSRDCHPTNYTKALKAACPTALTYQFDESLICKAANYTITFC